MCRELEVHCAIHPVNLFPICNHYKFQYIFVNFNSKVVDGFYQLLILKSIVRNAFMVDGSLFEVVCCDNCGVSLKLGRPPLRTRLLMLLPSPKVCVHLPPISLLSQVTATF